MFEDLQSDLSSSLYSPYDWVENSNASSAVKGALTDLIDIMTDTTIFDTESFEYATIKEGILEWEEAVMTNTNFDSTELVNLLTASSVARFSLLYWWEMDEQLQNNNSLQSNSLFGRRFLRWLGWGLIAAADALGAWMGTSICAPCSLAADIAAGVRLGGAVSAAGFLYLGEGAGSLNTSL